MDSLICGRLELEGYIPVKATTNRGTKDYLEKIINMIRASGFGVAIFSEHTPAATLANIFFEVGICALLGKPVIVVKTDNAKPPSDFKRTEWVTFAEDNDDFLSDFSEAIRGVVELADYFETIADIALAGDETDFELAFERYRQVFLIKGDSRILDRIEELLEKISSPIISSELMGPSRRRVRETMQSFVTFARRLN